MVDRDLDGSYLNMKSGDIDRNYRGQAMDLTKHKQNLYKTRLVNRQMEIMLEIGESCVKPIREIDKDGWKVSLEYRIG